MDLLADKIREFIAPAVAATVRCIGCVIVLVEAGQHNGATYEEILEALRVAMSFKEGAALVAVKAKKAKKAKYEYGR